MPKTPIDRLKINCKGIQIDTSFVSHSGKGQGARYLMNTDVDPRTALGNAIAAIYAPLGLVLSGAPRTEVEERVRQCKRIAQGYWDDALMSASNVQPETGQQAFGHQQDELFEHDDEDENEAF